MDRGDGDEFDDIGFMILVRLGWGCCFIMMELDFRCGLFVLNDDFGLVTSVGMKNLMANCTVCI